MNQLLPPAYWMVGLIFVLLLGLGVLVYFIARPLIRSDGAEVIPGASYVSAYQLRTDANLSNLSLEEVLQLNQSEAFELMPEVDVAPVLNQELGEDQWYRLDFHPNGITGTIILDLVWRVFDQTELYIPDSNGGWRVELSGAWVSKWDPLRSERWSAFELNIPADEGLSVYLHVTDGFRLPTQFHVWRNPSDFLQWERFVYVKNFGYFSLWVGMVAYGLFLYALLREKIQLYYAFFVFLFGGIQLISEGLIWYVLRPQQWPVGELLVAVFGVFSLFFLCLFARSFLSTKEEDPALDRWMRRTQRISLIPLCLSGVLFWPRFALIYLQFFLLIALIVIGFLVVASVRRWMFGSRSAPFFLLAFSPYFFSLLLRVFAAQDVVVRDDEFRLITLIGNALCLIFLSCAAAYRHRLTLEENFRLQASYVERLEGEVEERTRSLRKMGEELSEALIQKDRIMAVIGHDLRGPAATLQGLAELWSMDPDAFTREELAEMSEDIANLCTLQIELLNNLMMWGGSQRGVWKMQPTHCTIKSVLGTVWSLLKPMAAAKHLKLRDNLPDNLEAYVDEQLVQTLLRNLIANAIKFSITGKSIEVGGQRMEGGGLEIYVRDEGVGMSQEKVKALFQGSVESSSGTKLEKGAGIGLMLCYDMLVASGGNIRVESEEGVGTTLTFSVPEAEGRTE
ncbi:signal transduction histidine kinase [Puniceicoccus vermicola]|uniref:7TM diverse intracellular signaling domain-containing protein n=1 Tax=Puniceicoccus vermicola TaxID=388746 RepID=UPI00163A8211